jgi:hypothetical protein
MKARSVVVGVAAAGAMVFGSAMGASANISWCLEDPPVQVQTASGTNLTVNTAVSVPQFQAKYIGDVVIDAVTQPDGAGGTLITLYVSVPTSISVAKISATVKKYKISDYTTVAGGGSAVLHVDVPAA